MPAGTSETNVFEQDRAQFTYKWKTVMSRKILQTGPRIWPNFPQKTVGPNDKHQKQ